jgi:hypothetical protein
VFDYTKICGKECTQERNELFFTRESLHIYLFILYFKTLLLDESVLCCSVKRWGGGSVMWKVKVPV